MRARYLGEILIDEGLLTQDKLEEALKLQKKQLGEILVELGHLQAQDLGRALEIQAQGKTRAQVYLRWLRLALMALAVVTAVGTVALVQRLGDLRFREELEAGRLSAEKVLAVLEDRGRAPGERLDALASVANLKARDEQAFLLRRALRDPHWTVRMVALAQVRVLGVTGIEDDVIPLLLEPDGSVRAEAGRLLRERTGQSLPDDFKAWYHWAQQKGMKLQYPERMRGP